MSPIASAVRRAEECKCGRHPGAAPSLRGYGPHHCSPLRANRPEPHATALAGSDPRVVGSLAPEGYLRAPVAAEPSGEGQPVEERDRFIGMLR